jgi:hypothetical protein
VNKLNFWFDQLAGTSDWALFHTNIEQADKNLAKDIIVLGIISGLDVVPNSPEDLTVMVLHGIAYDAYGQRIDVQGDVNKDCSTYVPATVGNERWLTVVAKFARNNYDPHVDGYGETVFYKSDEYYEITILDGAIAPTGTAVKPSPAVGETILADVLLYYGQTSIIEGDISITRRMVSVSGGQLNSKKMDKSGGDFSGPVAFNNNVPLRFKNSTGRMAHWILEPDNNLCLYVMDNNNAYVKVLSILIGVTTSERSLAFTNLLSLVLNGVPVSTSQLQKGTPAGLGTVPGVYSNTDGENMKFVTRNGQFRFYRDGDNGSTIFFDLGDASSSPSYMGYTLWHNGVCTKTTNSNGYCKLGNGIILQWGNHNAGGEPDGTTITFPIAFPNAAIRGFISREGTLLNNVFFAISNLTVTGAKMITNVPGNYFSWFVLGY